MERHSLNSLDFTLGVAAVGAQAVKKRRRQRSVRDLRPLLVLLPAESSVLNQPNRKSSTILLLLHFLSLRSAVFNDIIGAETSALSLTLYTNTIFEVINSSLNKMKGAD